ncbi:hypothetical protein WICPIJ_008183 [Wickerhamomyces pijperi]|uniref:Uncharacterized protein n=1 Tax=Wickerhamomyces pijperi TaxID=599730 RepID=A0A9P8TJ32_WICPI|nr:hypothetical protein WICPIJ_008183 [Wickerhamomyces pijperi]
MNSFKMTNESPKAPLNPKEVITICKRSKSGYKVSDFTSSEAEEELFKSAFPPQEIPHTSFKCDLICSKSPTRPNPPMISLWVCRFGRN